MIHENDVFEQTYQLTSDIYQGFMQLFNDRNPLHADAAFAQQYGFDEVVMHGNILNGFLSHFVGECLPDKNVIILAQDINYLAPVQLGETLVLHVKVTSISAAVNAANLKFRFVDNAAVTKARGRLQIGFLQ